ncbi:MAG TPA: hypothetical protein VFA89_19110 [Terriglobales bacterium]|nr:hypothetical protein [Terriglobales bacterium]
MNYPGQNQTIFTGVNDSGEIVGYYVGPGPRYLPQGFIYQNGIFKVVKTPTGFANQVLGVNDNGDISGYYAIKNDHANQAFIGKNCH